MNQNDIEEMLSEAITLAKAGDRAPASGLIKKVLENDPNNITALLWSAYLCDDVNQIQATLRKILEIDPHNTKALEWQTLIQQKQPAEKPKPVNKSKRVAPGPLVNYNAYPVPIPSSSTQLGPLAGISDPNPTLNYANWQQSITNPNSSAPLAQQTPIAFGADYRIQEIAQPIQPQPVQVVIQIPESPKNNQNAPAWLIGLLVSLVLIVIVGIAFVVINQNGGFSSIGKPDKSVYRGFNTVDELMSANLESHERVDLVIPFEGGYTIDSQGFIRITKNVKNGILVIKWNTHETPITNYHSNELIRIYGTVEGINNTVTMNIEQATLERT